jgi:enterochelin esterase-like enzyme
MKKNNLTLAFLLINVALFAQNVKTASGTVTHFEQVPSKYGIAPRNVDVWLPDGYSTKQKYAVLYMHDGQMLFDSTITWNHQEWGVDETLTKLVTDTQIKSCIVVGVWNSGRSRHADYFPQKPFESLPKALKDSLIHQAKRNKETALFSTNVQSDAYLKFLVTELKPFIDSSFSTKKDRDNTFIAGSSMGGLISMYAICEYPSVFGGAACLSTHWLGIMPSPDNPVPDAFIAYLMNKLPNPKQHKLYFDHGNQTLDAFYKPLQDRVDVVMKAKGFDAKHWQTREFLGADHSEKSWKARLDIPFLFLLKK